MVSPPNPMEVPVVTYVYLFRLPSREQPRPPARSKARGLLLGSYTPGTMGHWLRPNKSRYGPVASSGKRLGNQIPHIGYSPPLLAEGEGPPT
jgi:hypothetical protein